MDSRLFTPAAPAPTPSQAFPPVCQLQSLSPSQLIHQPSAHPPLPVPLLAAEVIQRHDRCLALAGWPEQPYAPEDNNPLWWWVQRNHDFNARLWGEEDLARRTQVPAAEIANNKRAIDRFNQARNDATERIDELLLMRLGLLQPTGSNEFLAFPAAVGARLNSETAGAIIDRLSILALKIRAMNQQVLREDVGDEHRASCASRLLRLRQQRSDLGGCLDALLVDTRDGRAYFKLYRQFKMYNDVRMNPVLVAEQGASAAPWPTLCAAGSLL